MTETEPRRDVTRQKGAPDVSLPLPPFDVDTLERDPATICGLDADLRIAYVKPAWLAFARDNGGT
jgi:hypothetical protein